MPEGISVESISAKRKETELKLTSEFGRGLGRPCSVRNADKEVQGFKDSKIQRFKNSRVKKMFE